MRHLWAGLVLALGACAQAQPPASVSPASVSQAIVSSAACQTASASIAFDFEGASRSACVIEGERNFSIVISPEHAGPINPSPWFAFRYQAEPGAAVEVNLRYLGARHRYRPKWQSESGEVAVLDVRLADENTSASVMLPPGRAIVSGQPLYTSSRYAALLDRLTANGTARPLVLGQSHAGSPIEAIHIGDPAAPHLVVLLGRQHPPEVTGALAMESFLAELTSLVEQGRIDQARFQFLVVPFLNPDGVARGHWRANLGGRDLNRDWGPFTQPETRAVGDWLAALPDTARPIAMVDFHSTGENLFYVQGDDETDAREEAFLDGWLVGQEQAISGYPFTIERRNANPGSGTSKNWFHERYDIPAYTYEVGDETDPAVIDSSARVLARRFADQLEPLAAPAR